MIQVDLPEKLEARATELERKAMAIERTADADSGSTDKATRLRRALDLRSQADLLRRGATELKRRRTDGVRFG